MNASWRKEMPVTVRRLLAHLALAFLAVWTLAAWASPSVASAGVEYRDLTGEDAYDTSVVLSRENFAAGSEYAVVANGDDFRVSTCATVLAAAYEAPLLLTPADGLDAEVRQELTRLQPHTVFAVGVEASVAASIDEWPRAAGRTSASIQIDGVDAYAVGVFAGQKLRSLCYAVSPGLSDLADGWLHRLLDVRRVVSLAGEDAYETALLTAKQVVERAGNAEGVILALGKENSYSIESAVAASGLGAAKTWPMLFAPEDDEIAPEVAKAIADMSPATVVQIGVSADLDGGVDVVRLGNKNAYATAAAIAEYGAQMGLAYSQVACVGGPGMWSVHGWAVGAYIAREQGVIVLCGGYDVPLETMLLLQDVKGKIDQADFFGVEATVVQRTRLLLEEGALPEGFATTRLGSPSRGDGVAWVESRLAELGYRPGDVDGVFDARTRQAMIAFQKWEGMSRDGIVGEAGWWALLGGERPKPRIQRKGQWIEVDREKQVLLHCVDGQVERILAVSTGTSRLLYGQETPLGVFEIVRKNKYERRPRYHPMYIRDSNLAIHGYEYVPAYPASHGCIRISIPDMDDFEDVIPVGTRVYIYD